MAVLRAAGHPDGIDDLRGEKNGRWVSNDRDNRLRSPSESVRVSTAVTLITPVATKKMNPTLKT